MTVVTEENQIPSALTCDQLAHVLKSAGDTLRLDILRVLRRSSFGVQELASIFDVPQPGMSHHLKVLSKASLITSRREGNSLFYRRPLIRSTNPMKDLLLSLFDTVDQIEVSPEIAARVAQVHRDRSEQSREFFNRNASSFAEQQGKIVSFDQYGSLVKDLIQQMQGQARGLALELGPGDGELLSYLAETFEEVIAIDNSQDMLHRTEQAMARKGIDKVSFLHEEIETIVEREIQVDLLALNMVLHHMSAPQQIFSLFKRALKPGGVLLIAELCHHNQEWVKESCGDLWLGFHPKDLDEWGEACGLELGQSLYIGMKNGFQVQLKAFFNIEHHRTGSYIS
ncbi:ArsR/SmtB family transcription factor [Pseudobacteriovorax antillogorgiicola]|uniref:Transcriptional regulator, ArsR family n=1 Tax=Pseudobacteriovorax antillogorgiicola TaxID=1513793 RepID=A0A1Y6CIZ9_9BACT|nr:metalloregulator ArsR/SmtB family transcription factor [Pseudobacteriovorax antillogorgiicola]TCS48305.1 ArsR family transcriptional regulator [Pseudobacteriovorax antillogorgiicola]SMF56752.1 transcriptional regulator, ArsR family [Pseudobacteriovorax antillogorgiicola]